MRIKSIIKGGGSFLFPPWRRSPVGVDGAYSAAGSYALFMRYVWALHGRGLSFEDKVVLEFGPGASFGLGFAALICGAKRYYGYDLIDHTDPVRNIAIFDAILQMFRDRAPIPGDGFCGSIFPILENEAFPESALPDDLFRRTLVPERIDAIRKDIIDREGRYLRLRNSRDIGAASPDEPADLIISESVLEHVDDLESTYAFFARALAADGVMIHLIDYSCHHLAEAWNGHWACSPGLWSIVRGKREFLINRRPHQFHVDLLARNGMKVLQTTRLPRVDGVMREKFAPEFRTMSGIGAVTALAQVLVARDAPATSTSAG